MITVFYGSKKIILKGFDCKIGNNLRDVKLSSVDVNNILEFLKSETGEDIEAIATESKKKNKIEDIFSFIDAAGGIVKNENNEYLFIFRRGKWDLPKGKIEKGESIEKAAIREVKEECGLNKVIIENFICCTYHVYPLKGKFVLKTTYWYLMTAKGEQKLTPQTEEDITDLMWLNAANIQKVKTNTFPSILEVISLI